MWEWNLESEGPLTVGATVAGGHLTPFSFASLSKDLADFCRGATVIYAK